VEALDKAVGLRSAHARAPMPDVVEGQVDFVGMAVCPAELAAIIGQHCRDGQGVLPVEGQDVVVSHRHLYFWLLGRVQEAEGDAAVGVS